MRKIALTLILLGLLYSCEKEINVFEVSMQPQEVTFKAIEGGAEMQYTMPGDPKVFSILVRYKNWRGDEVLKVGGYGSDKIILDGFNQAQENVPVTITLADNNNIESEPIGLSFNTLDSAPYAFFNDVKVEPYWGGFQLSYKIPGRASGMVHVFYMGINPITNSQDTILVSSFPLINKEETVTFRLKQLRDKYDVIVRTEDFKGYRVREQSWKDVESYSVIKYDSEQLNFVNDLNLSIEDDKVDMVGAKYLFDGDTKGSKRLEYAYIRPGATAETFGFLAGPYAVGKPLIVELNEAKIPAAIRIYGILRTPKYTFPSLADRIDSNLKTVWMGSYDDKLPSEVTVYASNNKDGDDEEWVKLGSFKQDRLTEIQNRWTRNTAYYLVKIGNMAQLNEHDPAVMEVNLKAQSTPYRYLKVVVEDVFCAQAGIIHDINNKDKYVTMQELEVYVKN